MHKLKSTDILHSRNFAKDNSQDNKISENLSSIFVEAFENPNPSTLSPMQKRVELNRQLAQERKKIPVFTPTISNNVASKSITHSRNVYRRSDKWYYTRFYYCF